MATGVYTPPPVVNASFALEQFQGVGLDKLFLRLEKLAWAAAPENEAIVLFRVNVPRQVYNCMTDKDMLFFNWAYVGLDGMTVVLKSLRNRQYLASAV